MAEHRPDEATKRPAWEETALRFAPKEQLELWSPSRGFRYNLPWMEYRPLPPEPTLRNWRVPMPIPPAMSWMSARQARTVNQAIREGWFAYGWDHPPGSGGADGHCVGACCPERFQDHDSWLDDEHGDDEHGDWRPSKIRRKRAASSQPTFDYDDDDAALQWRFARAAFFAVFADRVDAKLRMPPPPVPPAAAGRAALERHIAECRECMAAQHSFSDTKLQAWEARALFLAGGPALARWTPPQLNYNFPWTEYQPLPADPSLRSWRPVLGAVPWMSHEQQATLRHAIQEGWFAYGWDHPPGTRGNQRSCFNRCCPEQGVSILFKFHETDEVLWRFARAAFFAVFANRVDAELRLSPPPPPPAAAGGAAPGRHSAERQNCMKRKTEHGKDDAAMAAPPAKVNTKTASTQTPVCMQHCSLRCTAVLVLRQTQT